MKGGKRNALSLIQAQTDNSKRSSSGSGVTGVAVINNENAGDIVGSKDKLLSKAPSGKVLKVVHIGTQTSDDTMLTSGTRDINI